MKKGPSRANTDWRLALLHRTPMLLEFRTFLVQTEASMRYVLQLSILLAAFGISTALASDRLRLAQAVPVPGQIAPQGQVLPAPLLPTPLISSQTSTACLVDCDTQVIELPKRLCCCRTYHRHPESRWQFALHPQLHDPTARVQTGVQQAAAVDVGSGRG